MPETMDWRDLDRADLSRAYDNSGAVADSAAIVAGWRTRSAAFREAQVDALDLAYGQGERQRIDVFRCGRPSAPMLAFLHGGYWQRNDRRGFSCMAEGPLARGLDVALVGYTLAPEARLTDIVAEARAALALLRAEGGGRRLVVSGWSAGGHLAAAVADAADAGLAISGIFDLAPIAGTTLNDALALSTEEIETLSPIRHLRPGTPPVAVVYGADELFELRRQSDAYHAARRAAGLDGPLIPVPGANHFTVLDGLIDPEGVISRTAARLAGL
ncbi:alpha/beta hydrolase fold domain-containing protein [Methylobacterium sp. WL12]|uniref:alpha/beta hydrolase n=1 Tax=Methylobacterium sp. WL12 TaxID=2603890 RepID=UPI0011C87C43|nr:alpha/beta hydrolase [Methylobacterium sp. WL12]TXM76006.1 alpha/beta hydrolase fold domain-containing protein [Methylobacterium sp. WL12]